MALSDDLDNTFVVLATGSVGAYGFPASRLIARWLDAKGTAITAWTDVGEEGSIRVRPLIGGGAVLRVFSSWVGTFRSGVAKAEPPPAFLGEAGPPGGPGPSELSEPRLIRPSVKRHQYPGSRGAGVILPFLSSTEEKPPAAGATLGPSRDLLLSCS